MSDGSVTIDVSLEMSKALKDLEKLESTIKKASSGTSNALSTIGSGFQKLGSFATSAGKVCSVVTTAVTGVFTAAAAKAKSFIGTYESAMAVFSRKLDGGTEAAGQLYDSLLTVAKGSSFAQEHLVSAGQTLVAMGIDAGKTTKYVQIATDAIAGMGGTGNDIQALTEVFGKMAMQTNVYTDDLNQLAMKGIPVFDILATKYKTTKDKVKEMASKGMLPAAKTLDVLTEALECTDEASEYFQYSIAGMAQSLKSGTLTGALDSLNSNFRTFALNLLDLDPRTESGKAHIEKLIDVVGAFGAILEDCGSKFSFVGDWISDFLDKLVTVETTVDENGNTIKKYGGYLGELKDKLDSLSEEQLKAVAKAILEIASAGPKLIILGKILTTVGSAFNGLSTAVSIIGKVGTAVTGLGEVIALVAGGAGTLHEALVAVFGGVATTIAGVVAVVGGAILAVKSFLSMLSEGFSWVKEGLMVLGVAIAAVGAIILGVPAAIAAGIAAAVAVIATIVVVVKEHWEEIKNIFSTAKDFIINKVKEIGDFFKTLPNRLKDIIYNGIFSLWDRIPEKFNSIFEALAENVDSIISIFSSIFGAIKTTIETALFVIKSLLTGNFGEAVEAIKALFIRLGTIIASIWENIKSIFLNNIEIVISLAKMLFENIASALQTAWSSLTAILQQTWDSIVSFFTESIPAFISSVITWFSELPYNIGYLIGLVLGHIIQFGIDAWMWVTTEVPKIIEGIVTFFSELPGKIWNFLLDIINKIITWGKTIWENAKTYTMNLINDVTNFFSTLPGKIWQFLSDIISKVINWGQTTWNNAKTYASNLVNDVTNFFSQLPGKIQAHLTNIISRVVEWGSNMVARGREAAVNLVNTVHTTIAELPSRVMEVGRNIVEGLWNGIQGAGDWIRGKVGEFARGILDGMKAALGIHSPSRVFRDEVGKYIALGVGEGFTNNIASVYKKMKASVDFETQKISASVSANTELKASKNQSGIVNNDSTTINNTQNFYSKNSTPYEEQKQAKQQLRRLAYGL